MKLNSLKRKLERSSPLPWHLASSRRGNMMAELRLDGERMAVVYMRGSDCTTTGIRCTWLGSLLGLDGGTGWMMCKNCWPLTPWEDPTKGPVVNTEGIPEETEVITEGEGDDEEEDGEKAEVTGEALCEGDDVRVLMDRSTGSVWVWNWSEERKSSGGSAFTLLIRSGMASISG